MLTLFFGTSFFVGLLMSAQPTKSQTVLAMSDDLSDLEVDMSGARSQAQALLTTTSAPESSSLEPSFTVELEFDVSGAFSQALLTTLTSTIDYSTSRPTERSKLASNLYFNEKVEMYRVQTEIVYRQGSPTEIRYRSKLPKNTWTIYSQQGTSATSELPGSVTRKKREVSSSLDDQATWSEVLFRQGSPTEIRYHSKRNRPSQEDEHNFSTEPSSNAERRKRREAKFLLKSNSQPLLQRQKPERHRQRRDASETGGASPHSKPGENEPVVKFPLKGNWTYFHHFLSEPNRKEFLNSFTRRPGLG